MTTPRVTELPRRLEPIGGDTFIGAYEPDTRPRSDVVVQLRPRDASRPPRARRRGARRPLGPGPSPGPGTGPGPDAA